MPFSFWNFCDRWQHLQTERQASRSMCFCIAWITAAVTAEVIRVIRVIRVIEIIEVIGRGYCVTSGYSGYSVGYAFTRGYWGYWDYWLGLLCYLPEVTAIDNLKCD